MFVERENENVYLDNSLIKMNVERRNDIMYNTEMPTILNINIYNQAIYYLRKSLDNPNANFRKGQYEAIEAVFTNKRS
ncbi:MAG TPA: hypothetical protein PKV66_03050 [Candidatus Pelethenecus sp.]|nr:hypothetical protein [Candidatus Pelethenecus sp.]